MRIPIEQIFTRQNYRTNFDDIDTLALSIYHYGQKTPITVKPADNGQYALIAGERRYRAFLYLLEHGYHGPSVDTIRAEVEHGTDKDSFLSTLSENLARQQTNPIEDGRGFAHGLELGHTIETMALISGLRCDAIERRLSLLNLRDDIQKLVADGNLGITYATAMIELDHNRQLLAMCAFQDNPTPSIKWYRGIVAELLEQQRQQSFSFGLFGDGSDMVLPDNMKVTLPDNPKHYRPSFNPLNMTEDISQQLAHWQQTTAAWDTLGKPNMVAQCKTIVDMLAAMLAALPAVAASDNPADRVYRTLLERGQMTTRQIYQFCNITRSQWGTIKFNLLTAGRISEIKAGRGYRYNAV